MECLVLNSCLYICYSFYQDQKQKKKILNLYLDKSLTSCTYFIYLLLLYTTNNSCCALNGTYYTINIFLSNTKKKKPKKIYKKIMIQSLVH